jgi:flagellar protein FlaJ
MSQALTGIVNFNNISRQKKIMMISGILGLVIGVIIVRQAVIGGDILMRNIGIAIGLLIAVGPSMLLNMRNEKRGESIDQYLPVFLLNLVGAMQSGMTLLKAIERAADRDYGSLSHELKNLRANISWGMPYDEAFEQLGNRLGSVMGKRVSGVIYLALRSGGNSAQTIEMIQKFVSDMRNLEKERRSAMKPYILTIYISFAVFLVTAVLLVDNFFSEIENVQKQLKEAAGASGGLSSTTFSALLGMNVAQLNDLLFHMSLIEALFGGLAAGKIGTGKFTAGIPHIVMLTVITLIAFSVVGTGTLNVTNVAR